VGRRIGTLASLARVSACSSFNFAKRWHFVSRFTVRLLSVVSSVWVAAIVLQLGDMAD
jgi:hypothetical protein